MIAILLNIYITYTKNTFNICSFKINPLKGNKIEEIFNNVLEYNNDSFYNYFSGFLL